MDRKNEISIDHLVVSYLEHHTLRPSSEKNYRNGLARLAQEKNVVLLSDLTEELLISWKNDVLERATATTWNSYHTHLRALLNFALKKCWVAENVLLNVPRARKPQLKKKTIELASLELIFKTLNLHEEYFAPKWFWEAVIKVLFYTGMRQNQLVSLKWRDINFDKQEIFLSLEGSKTHREWTIPLPDGCANELITLKEKTLERRGVNDISSDPVFRLQLFNEKFSGFGIKGYQIENFFKKLSRLSGEKISSHRLRHTMATMIAQNGNNPDLKSLQHILGHTDIRTTMEYIEPKQEHL